MAGSAQIFRALLLVPKTKYSPEGLKQLALIGYTSDSTAT
jgi:hypothetical protein